jgi:hypothetical protein
MIGKMGMAAAALPSAISALLKDDATHGSSPQSVRFGQEHAPYPALLRQLAA